MLYTLPYKPKDNFASVSKSDFHSLTRATESTVRSERRPARNPCSYATVFDELCSAQADGSESEIGAGICGTLDLGGTDTPVLPCGFKAAAKLLFEFEARNGFMTDILKYIKIGFAGGVFQPLLLGPHACGCSEPGSACADLLGNP